MAVTHTVAGVSNIDPPSLVDEIEAVVDHRVEAIRVVGADTVVGFPTGTVLTGGDQTAIDTAVGAHDPSNRNELDRDLIARIELRADAKIRAAGFTYNSNDFGATDRDIRLWNLLMIDRAALTYPRTVRTKDRSTSVSLADAADVLAHWQALRTALVSELEASQTAIQNVLDAADADAARTAAAAYTS